MSQLSQLSKEYLKRTDLHHRKALGQYFTPKFVREHLLSKLPKTKKPLILDPACGTGEFLLSAKEYFDNPGLYGWEIDETLVKLSKKNILTSNIIHQNALNINCSELYDFVIGNPPYFEFKPDKEIKKKFHDVINGRPNIFSMFIKIGLEMLKNGGYLAYVIPPSMNNGAYFSKLRKYIIKHANIEYMTILKSSTMFHDALQTVMIIVLKKGRNKNDYIFTKNDIDIFSIKPEQLKKAFAGKTTLKELGYTVRTGKVVWNQHKDKLTDKPRGSVPLIRAHNITENGIVLENSPKKQQYIKTNKYDTGPAIIVNRITGAAAKVNLKAAVIKPGMKFLGENHVNVIYPPSNNSNIQNTNQMIKICNQITSPETKQTMQLISGNTQISRTELECLLPLELTK